MKSNSDGWNKKALKEFNITSFKGVNATKVNDGDSILVPSGAVFPDGIHIEKCSRIDRSELNERDRMKELMDGDVLFNTGGMGTLGRVCYFKKDKSDKHYYSDAFVLVIRVTDPELSSNYLFYWLRSTQAQAKIERFTVGSTGITAIRTKDVMSFELSYPAIKNQMQIVTLLKKVENLKRLRTDSNRLINEFLKSVFYDMFGDDRINNKKNEEILFLDLFNVTTGKLNSNASNENGKYPFFTCSKQTFKIDSYSFDCEALLLSGNNAAGEYSVKHYNGKFDAYQRTYILTLKDKQNSYEYFQFLLEKKLAELKSISIGTNTKYLTLGLMKNIKFMMPATDLQIKFAKIVKQIKKIGLKHKNSQQSIENLFDVLIQDAFE